MILLLGWQCLDFSAGYHCFTFFIKNYSQNILQSLTQHMSISCQPKSLIPHSTIQALFPIHFIVLHQIALQLFFMECSLNLHRICKVLCIELEEMIGLLTKKHIFKKKNDLILILWVSTLESGIQTDSWWTQENYTLRCCTFEVEVVQNLRSFTQLLKKDLRYELLKLTLAYNPFVLGLTYRIVVVWYLNKWFSFVHVITNIQD